MSAHQFAVDQSQTPALLVGTTLRVLHANDSAHALLGYPAGRLTGEAIASLLHPRRQAELRNFEQLLVGGGDRRWRTVLQSYDGRRRDVAVALSACIGSDGEIEAVHVRVEEAAIRTTSTPPTSSGVHASVRGFGSPPSTPPPIVETSGPPSSHPHRPSGRPTSVPAAHARTTPPPGTDHPVPQVSLEDLRRRLVAAEARVLPATEPMSIEDRAQLSRTLRDALALLDEIVQGTSRQD